jgi:predicted RNA binding protein YcfA (HicA-like mRNA interferase family)
MSKTTLTPSQRKLSNLRRTNNGWEAEMGGKHVTIKQDQKTRRWTAKHGKKKTEGGTFKDVIAELREEARNL